MPTDFLLNGLLEESYNLYTSVVGSFLSFSFSSATLRWGEKSFLENCE